MEFDKLETVVEKEDSTTINGRELHYRFLFEKGTFKDTTEITAFTYINTEGKDHPVIFVTNGGPGSGVVWQHLGFFGPQRIRIPDIMHPPVTPPYTLEANPFCLLDIADIVLIDPPGTGYSRLNEETKKEYESVDGDAVAVGIWIQNWIAAHGRVNSPLYFMGESYGTVRAPAVLEALYGGAVLGNKHLAGFSLNGVILLGTAFSTGSSEERASQPIKPALNLLSCAATYALHTGKDPYKAAEEAWAFTPEYVKLLFEGRNASLRRRRAAAEKIAAWTGLDAETLLKNHLSFTMMDFMKKAIPDRIIGFYDGRYLMNDHIRDEDYDVLADDSGMGMFIPAYTAGAYLLAEKYGLPKVPYDLLNCVVNTDWDRKGSRTSLSALENAQRRNEDLRIMFANGLYDLCTVAGNVRFTVARSHLDPVRTEIHEYPGGHMAYVGDDSAALLAKDLRAFILAGTK